MRWQNVSREELEVIASRFYDALDKISCKAAKNKDYESAYWDIVLEADAALYPEEYSRKEGRDKYTKNAHLPSGRYPRTNLTSIELARKGNEDGRKNESKD